MNRDIKANEWPFDGTRRKSQQLQLLGLEIIMERFNLSFEEGKDAISRYRNHLSNRRNDPGFELSLVEWVAWWEELDDNGIPRKNNRGNRPGCYVMGRICDVGPYHVDNIRCLLHEDNFNNQSFINFTEEEFEIYKRNKIKHPEWYTDCP
jgi:hypothetical protein